ncbi:MAG: cupin domain-containing protein [Haliscomenobacter sp.]|nr:cupin domain-containing protein [Haliscomenobacter sp.]
MKIELPHTIENCVGEKINFRKIISEPAGGKVLLYASCEPGCGPAMHVHFKQDESLTVVKGRMGFLILGEEPKEAGVGETVLFKRGTPHKFWSAGTEPLECEGWIQPVNSVIYYLSKLYAAQNKSGKGQPEAFDSAYLLLRYKSEYDLPEIPAFVKSVILPITYAIGRLTGKYKHFEGAPEPLK